MEQQPEGDIIWRAEQGASCICCQKCIHVGLFQQAQNCHLLPPTVQALDPHANEYMERLKDEAVLLALAQKVHPSCCHTYEPCPEKVPCCPSLARRFCRLWSNFAALQVSQYLEAHNELDKLAGVALKRIQHFYYKTGKSHSHILWGGDALLEFIKFTLSVAWSRSGALFPLTVIDGCLPLPDVSSLLQMWCTVPCASWLCCSSRNRHRQQQQQQQQQHLLQRSKLWMGRRPRVPRVGWPLSISVVCLSCLSLLGLTFSIGMWKPAHPTHMPCPSRPCVCCFAPLLHCRADCGQDTA